MPSAEYHFIHMWWGKIIPQQDLGHCNIVSSFFIGTQDRQGTLMLLHTNTNVVTHCPFASYCTEGATVLAQNSRTNHFGRTSYGGKLTQHAKSVREKCINKQLVSKGLAQIRILLRRYRRTPGLCRYVMYVCYVLSRLFNLQ